MNIPLVDLKAQYLTIKPEIDQAIQEILDTTRFIMGPPVKNFEEHLAQFCNCQHAIGVSSGSSALFLALKAYGIKTGDEVITVANSFIATAEAIVQCGATPVFVDVTEDTLLLDPSKLESAITEKTKMIIPVHLYGQICDMDPIINIARKHNLIIVEDAAQAIDAKYKNKSLPIHETAIFSFFPAKNLGCYGDGGAVITNNQEIAHKVAKLKDHGRISKYESDIIGYGERLDALQAAILTVKLKHLSSWSEKRKNHAHKYNQLLQTITNITLPTEKEYSKHVYYMYVIKTKNRDELMNKLKEKGVDTGIHYPLPLHLQPSLNYLGYKEGDFPIAEQAAKEILSLPMFPELKEEQINEIVTKISEVNDNVHR
ncbi:MAG: DegT/DnrJ/EryC1/StrS family aminotransferase [Nanoarchaeota archaeon]|nr:DegT/DnrJ/EryC1/StrS family aminotransferase [Nanoarchaeota archaeon]MBU1622603.1 DegT/DnrJ/EryC1/StrS family aminotransferase [Nanoarchaeota archaeon]MBU1974152.1 DegT/DnrJ/EryC1/StrS family aminotransferase [Nanoarchaeota archaeon]